jgi:hypothetical protein
MGENAANLSVNFLTNDAGFCLSWKAGSGSEVGAMRSAGLFPFLLACCAILPGVKSFGVSTPSFTVTAANVMMPSNGSFASSKFTLASVNSYSGQLLVSCAYSGGEMGARVPTCGIYVNPMFTLGANQTVSGTLTLSPYGKVIPYSMGVRPRERSNRLNQAPALVVALACVLLLRRGAKGPRWLAVVVLGAISIASITGCGGNGLSGVFPYTVTATDVKTNTSANASIMVTVP